MKKIAATVATLLFGAGASACPMWASVSEQYGISAGGIISSPPRAGRLAGGPFTRIEAPESLLASDGFRHTLLTDRAAGKLWIRRSGGYAGVSELFGPIDIGAHSLEGCEASAGPDARSPAPLPPGRVVTIATPARGGATTPGAPGTP